MSVDLSSPPSLPSSDKPKRATLTRTAAVTDNSARNEHHYININYLDDGQPDISAMPLAPHTGKQYRPHYVNIPIDESHSGTGTRPESSSAGGERKGDSSQTPLSRPVLEVVEIPPAVRRGKMQRAETHVPPSHNKHLPPRQVPECSQCEDLLEWLSLWELGVSGLTRQYSQILAQLNHARDAATIIECKMKERGREQGGERGGEGQEGGNSTKFPPRKHSPPPVEEGSVSQSTNTIVDQMYPPRRENTVHEKDDTAQLPAEYVAHFAELTSRLARAIDLCQQLAASSFKTQTSSLLKMKMKGSIKKNVKRQVSTPLHPNVAGEPPSSSQQPLASVGEDAGSTTSPRKHKFLTRMETEPILKISEEVGGEGEGEGEKRAKQSKGEKQEQEELPAHSYTKAGLTRAKTQHATKKAKPSKSSLAGDLMTVSENGELETQPVHSHMMSLIARDEEGERGGGATLVLTGSSESDEGEEGEGRRSFLRRASTFSDTDVKQVMSKIALLEDERLKLLETIDHMQKDNQSVRLSLYETLGDLESKDLLLTLAMQDLTIATGEIKKVTGMRSHLDNMETERKGMLDKLNNLEDESAAVKVSLIQLLQEKSATNKTLALENWRLRKNVRPEGGTLTRADSSGPNVSAQEHSLPENYIKDADLSNYVHKQGFLVKQGRRVKSWKRRLFVLDSKGLSYFKTEQPIQTVPLSQIMKIQISHDHLILPNMFEVHTKDRIFLLSAPSEDEMQSWIGMLQTLKQYVRQQSPPGGGVPVTNGAATNGILHTVAMKNGAAQSDLRRLGSVPASSVAEVQTRSGEGRPERNGGHGGRPRSHAFTMSKNISLDEATPYGYSTRPMSAMITTYPGHSSTEYGQEETTTAAAGNFHQSHDSSGEYNRSVLSHSLPDNRTPALLETRPHPL